MTHLSPSRAQDLGGLVEFVPVSSVHAFRLDGTARTSAEEADACARCPICSPSLSQAHARELDGLALALALLDRVAP